MPWVRAALRGQKVFARADEAGQLVQNGGRVEVRYKANDGRKYEASAANLAVDPGEILPDSACGEAAAVVKAEGATKGKAAPAPSAPIAPGTVIAYADGACSGNPGPSGLGVVILDGATRLEVSEFLGEGTNNIAELTAILRAVEAVPAQKPLLIHTDSQYSIGVLQKGWKAKANQQLVADVRAAIGEHKATRIVYVPGHAGVVLNERADALAREAVTSRKTRREEIVSKKVE